MVLMDGVAAGSASVLSRLQDGPFLAYRGEYPDLEPFSSPDGLQGRHALGWIEPAILESDSSSAMVKLLALSDPGVLYPIDPGRGEAYAAASLMARLDLSAGSTILLTIGQEVLQLNLAGSLQSSVSLPDTWLMVSEEDLRDALGQQVDAYNLLLLEQRQDASRIEGRGFTVLSLSSAADFFAGGLEEARRVVLSIVVASSIAIGALAFSLLSLEVRYRRRELDTLRAMGLDPWGFARLYGLQLAFILLTGTGLGIAMGIVVANGLVSFAPFFGLTTVIKPQVTAPGLLLPITSSLLAGFAGGVATITLTLRRLSREARA
jgi:hypothetical protein